MEYEIIVKLILVIKWQFRTYQLGLCETSVHWPNDLNVGEFEQW
jgi:hypothetical protein